MDLSRSTFACTSQDDYHDDDEDGEDEEGEDAAGAVGHGEVAEGNLLEPWKGTSSRKEQEIVLF